MKITKTFDNLIDNAIVVLAIAMVAYHLLSAHYLIAKGPIQFQNTHLFFAMVLVFLSSARKGKRPRLLLAVVTPLTVIALGYVQIYEPDLELRVGFPTTVDVIIGVIIILLVAETTRRAFGWVFINVTAVSMLYGAFGHYLTGTLEAAVFSFPKLMSRWVMGLTGIYGTVLPISSDYIFLFIVFGAIIQISGAAAFFEQVGKVITQTIKGGGGLVAVVASCLMGMVSGSVAANVVTSGTFTIPLMKKIGYKPHQAGAIEATASTGGQVMPPIMGAAAFVMAGITGISYISITLMAYLPALLYFSSVGLYVYLWAGKIALPARWTRWNPENCFSQLHCFSCLSAC